MKKLLEKSLEMSSSAKKYILLLPLFVIIQIIF